MNNVVVRPAMYIQKNWTRWATFVRKASKLFPTNQVVVVSTSSQEMWITRTTFSNVYISP